MAIRAIVLEDVRDDEVTLAVSVKDGEVRLLWQVESESDETDGDPSVYLDIRDIISAVTFLDNADKAPALEEHMRAQFAGTPDGIVLGESLQQGFREDGS